jgi:hypothetical protein
MTITRTPSLPAIPLIDGSIRRSSTSQSICIEKIFFCAFCRVSLPIFLFYSSCAVTAIDNRHFDMLDIRPHRLERLPLHWEPVIPVSGGNQCARSLAATRPLRMHGRVQATIEWRGLTSTFQHQPRWPEESLQISQRPPMRRQGSDLTDQPPRKGCRRRRLST